MAIRRYMMLLSLTALLLAPGVQALAAQVHTFQVDGLACPFCSYGVEKQLRTIAGVRDIKISIKTGTVTVTMRDGASLSREQADRAVKAAGFTMRNFR